MGGRARRPGPGPRAAGMTARRPGGKAARAGLAALLLLGASPAARGQERPALPGIGAADPRRPVDHAAEPWRALGRVQTEAGGRCTGVLVGPRTVLTAAHCLVAPRTGRLVRPGAVHFLLGYHLGGWAAHARAAAYRIGEGYDPAARRPAGADWAVLTLERTVGAPDRVLPLLREAPAPRMPLALAGYQQDRPEALLADTACRVLGLGRDAAGLPLLLHDCAGTRGASGAPLLARDAEGRWAVAGIASAAAAALALGAAVPAGAIRGVP